MPNIIETTDAAAGTSTAYTLTAGQTAQGTLSTGSDHDWYRVDLVAGQTYTFAMTGTGVNNVQDTYLRLYAPGGTALVAQNDDGLEGSNSVFTYTATASGTHYIDAGSYNNAGSGQYGVSFTAGPRASFDLQMGAGVMDTEASWSATPGTGANVTYGFRLTNNGVESTFYQCTSAQTAAVQSALDIFSQVCGLTFTQVNPGGYTDSATMLFSNYNENDGAGAYAYYPGPTASSSNAGDVWLNASVSTNSLPVGGYSYFAIAHEIGHAVGLSHPGKYNAAPGLTITYGADAQFIQDTHQYSIMSYFDESYTTGSYFSYPDTLMLHDIYALQQIYGANTATRNTDTIYGFGSTAGDVYNFAINTNPAMCIWDGGGIDTLNISGFSQSQTINLNAGTFSDIGGFSDNVSIAYGVSLERVVSGSGADQIYLSNLSVDNMVDSGGGTDVVHVTYTAGAGYNVSGTASNFTMTGGSGADTFQNVEYIIFSDGVQISAVDLLGTQPSTTGQIRISDVTITEGNSGTKVATFDVTRTGGTAAFAVNFATANGTAAAGSDYVTQSGTLNFGTGINSQTVLVTINGDTAIEANEAFFVNLSSATNGATIADSQGQGTIIDDDTPPAAGSIAIGDLTITEGNSGSQVATFVVTRTGGTAAFAVNYATANGTATAGSDYVAGSGALNFGADVNSQTVSVTINGDTTIEPNETFFVNLSGATNGATIADAQSQGTIIDNDAGGDDFADSFTDTAAPFGLVNLGGSTTGNLETSGDQDWFQIALTGGITVTVDLRGVATSDGTLADPYVYLYNSAGQLLSSDDDTGVGYNSQLVYTPSASGTYYIGAGAYANAGTGTYTVSVSTASPVAGSISISDLTITEGNSGSQVATFTVTRTGGTAAFAVNYATANGTATAGSDYVAGSGTLNFGAGVNSQTVAVTINGDTAIEPNETFIVNLSGATNGATITDAQGQGTIIDNDGGGDDFADSFTDTSAPFGLISVGGSTTGNLESVGDQDWFRITLTGGTTATIDLRGVATSDGTLGDPYVYLYNSAGQLITQDDDSGDSLNSRLVYVPSTSGTYYIAASAFANASAGTYTVSVTAPQTAPDDFADSVSDTTAPFGLVGVGGSTTGNLESVGDQDWFRVTLTGGIIVTIDLRGVDTGHGTLADPYLYLYNSAGQLLAVDDDSGDGFNSQLAYTPTTSGTYYVRASAFADAGAGTYTVSVAGDVSAQRSDFNGDLRSDVLWQNNDGRAGAWLLNGTSVSDTAVVGPNPGPSWHIEGTGDFNHNGRSDIVWQNDDGRVAIWFLNGTNLAGDGVIANNPGPTWDVIDTGNYNTDRKSDLLWQNNDGRVAVWLLDGTTQIGGAVVGENPGPAWHVMASGDFSGDGQSDILWQNNDGRAAVWILDGMNFVRGAVVSENPGPSWHIIDSGDFNADGKSDILWQNDDGRAAIWFLDGSSFAGGSVVGSNPGPSWHAEAAGDHNGDGTSDILWQHDNGQAGIWLMSGFGVLSSSLIGSNPGPTWHVDWI